MLYSVKFFFLPFLEKLSSTISGEIKIYIILDLSEDISVGDVRVIDLKRGWQQLEEVIILLPFLLHEQIGEIIGHAVLQVFADSTFDL